MILLYKRIWITIEIECVVENDTNKLIAQTYDGANLMKGEH